MYTIKTTGQFKKGVKRCQKRGYDMALLREALKILAETGTLPESYLPHKLTGDYRGIGNAIYNPTGFSFGRNTRKLLHLL